MMPTRARAGLVLALATGFLVAGSALAHHSLSPFDRATTLMITGKVTEFQWTNPHVWIEMSLGYAAGMPENWSIQGSSPEVLARGGWRPTLLKPGDEISLGVHPRKDGEAGGYLADEEALVVNGHELIAPLTRSHDPEAGF